MSFWSAIAGAARAVGGFAADHWKEIAVVAASTVVFAGVLVLTGGTAALLAPTLAQLALAGVASGAAGQVVGDLLDGRTPTVGDVAKGALIGGVLTVATGGLGRFVPGLARPLENQIAQRAVITAAGSAGGAGAQVMSNAIDGQPLLANVGQAAVRGGATTLLASEGLRVVAPRIVNAANRESQTTPRGREIVPEPEPRPALTAEQAAERARAASAAQANELRSPGGQPVTGKALNEVPRAVTVAVDRTTGESYTGVTGGELNPRMARVLAEQGYDLTAMQRNLDVEGLRNAMRNPEVRRVLDPRIADQILDMPPERLTAIDPNTNAPFLALPWNCSEVQALNAALSRGAQPGDLSVATTFGRTNPGRIALTGTPFKSCPRCESVVGRFRAENVTDQDLGHAHTQTGDTTAQPLPPPPSSTKGFTRALGGVGE